MVFAFACFLPSFASSLSSAVHCSAVSSFVGRLHPSLVSSSRILLTLTYAHTLHAHRLVEIHSCSLNEFPRFFFSRPSRSRILPGNIVPLKKPNYPLRLFSLGRGSCLTVIVLAVAFTMVACSAGSSFQGWVESPWYRVGVFYVALLLRSWAEEQGWKGRAGIVGQSARGAEDKGELKRKRKTPCYCRTGSALREHRLPCGGSKLTLASSPASSPLYCSSFSSSFFWRSNRVGFCSRSNLPDKVCLLLSWGYHHDYNPPFSGPRFSDFAILGPPNSRPLSPASHLTFVSRLSFGQKEQPQHRQLHLARFVAPVCSPRWLIRRTATTMTMAETAKALTVIYHRKCDFGPIFDITREETRVSVRGGAEQLTTEGSSLVGIAATTMKWHRNAKRGHFGPHLLNNK